MFSLQIHRFSGLEQWRQRITTDHKPQFVILFIFTHWKLSERSEIRFTEVKLSTSGIQVLKSSGLESGWCPEDCDRDIVDIFHIAQFQFHQLKDLFSHLKYWTKYCRYWFMELSKMVFLWSALQLIFLQCSSTAVEVSLVGSWLGTRHQIQAFQGLGIPEISYYCKILGLQPFTTCEVVHT